MFKFGFDLENKDPDYSFIAFQEKWTPSLVLSFHFKIFDDTWNSLISSWKIKFDNIKYNTS